MGIRPVRLAAATSLRRRLRPMRRSAVMAAALLLLGLAGMSLAARRADAPNAAIAKPATPPSAWQHPGLSGPAEPTQALAPTVPDQLPVNDRATTPTPPIAASATTAVAIDPVSGELHIAVTRAARGDIARQLAALTGSELRIANEALLEHGGPLTLHWQGRDAFEAWQLLLGASASHALQCEGLRCRVWLLGDAAAAPGTAAAATAAPQTAPVQLAAAPPAATARPAAPAAAPGGARKAPAQTLATAPQQPPRAHVMQPDPPGLFPSE
jgi:hypothetical protein